MDFGVVIVAAGQGRRMGSKEKKQFLMLGDKPVLYHSVQLFKSVPGVKEIVVVTSEEDIGRATDLLAEFAPLTVTSGGPERQDSVLLGLRALRDAQYALIHDAARPFATRALVERVMNKALETGAAIPAIPAQDTIKIVNAKGEVESTPPRQSLRAAQTPQAFRLSAILRAHEKAREHGFVGTDDSMLMEWQGVNVSVVEGEHTNLKLTTPADFKLGELILEQRRGLS